MTGREIVQSFYAGYSIDTLTEREWAEQKKDRLERQKAYHKQVAYIRAQREKNKRFKLPRTERVIVGPPATRFLARSVIEQAIYQDLKASG